MNKINLIRVGAYAQAKYKMRENFEIVEFPSDASPSVMVAIQSSLSTAPVPYVPFFSEYEEIEFEKLCTSSKAEQIWVGYGRKSNTLAIKEMTKKE